MILARAEAPALPADPLEFGSVTLVVILARAEAPALPCTPGVTAGRECQL